MLPIPLFRGSLLLQLWNMKASARAEKFHFKAFLYQMLLQSSFFFSFFFLNFTFKIFKSAAVIMNRVFQTGNVLKKIFVFEIKTQESSLCF